MTDQEINIAVAEACGWNIVLGRKEPEWFLCFGDVVTYIFGWHRGTPKLSDVAVRLPDYCHDWNTIKEAVNSLNKGNRLEFLHHLDIITERREPSEWSVARIASSTLAEWCEAFLRTVGKLKE